MAVFIKQKVKDPKFLNKINMYPEFNMVKMAMKHGPFNYRQIYLYLIEQTDVCLGNQRYKEICKSYTLEICTREFFCRCWGITMPSIRRIYLNELCFERPIFLLTTLMHEIKHIVADMEERIGVRSTVKYLFKLLTVPDYCHKGHFLDGLQHIEETYGVYILGNRILKGYDVAEKREWKQQADVFISLISSTMHQSWLDCYLAKISSTKQKIWKYIYKNK